VGTFGFRILWGRITSQDGPNDAIEAREKNVSTTISW